MLGSALAAQTDRVAAADGGPCRVAAIPCHRARSFVRGWCRHGVRGQDARMVVWRILLAQADLFVEGGVVIVGFGKVGFFDQAVDKGLVGFLGGFLDERGHNHLRYETKC